MKHARGGICLWSVAVPRKAGTLSAYGLSFREWSRLSSAYYVLVSPVDSSLLVRGTTIPHPHSFYHPGPLLFANGFLVLSSICCTLSVGPNVLYENMNFKTWLHVTKALKTAAIATYIPGSVLTIYGSVRLFMEVNMHRAYPRPRVRRTRRESRRAQREWLKLA